MYFLTAGLVMTPGILCILTAGLGMTPGILYTLTAGLEMRPCVVLHPELKYMCTIYLLSLSGPESCAHLLCFIVDILLLDFWACLSR